MTCYKNVASRGVHRGIKKAFGVLDAQSIVAFSFSLEPQVYR